MLVFKRKYSVNIKRNAFYFGALFVPLVAGWSCILIYGFPEVAEHPVNLALFGKHFVWAHAWSLLGLVAYFLLGWLLGKAGYIKYPVTEMAQEEITAYNQKYQANFTFPGGNGKYYFIALSSLLILPLLISLPHFIFENDPPKLIAYFFYLAGFILMCKLFYGAIRKIMQKGSLAMVEAFDHANAHIPNTKIQLKGQSLDHSSRQMSVSTGLNIEGQFKKRSISITHHAFGTRRHVSSNGGIELETPLKLKLSICEQDKVQNKISGSTLDECFKKRFKVRGIKVEMLPDVFKQKLLESFKSVDLNIEDGKMNQSFKFTDYLPFYSAQGIILFLDFMLEMAEGLEKINT